MSQQYKAAAAILTGAIADINLILAGPDDELHKLKLIRALEREADYLLLVTGAGDLTQNNGLVLGPAKTIGGKPIGKLPRITERDLKPSDDAVLNLKGQAESALIYFGPDGSSEGILANIPDLVVRAVARKAGFKVTKEEPKELTVEFIDQIKEALLVKGLVEPKGMSTEDSNLIDEYNAEKNLPIVVGQGGVSEVHIVSSVDINTKGDQEPNTETSAETPAPAEPAPVDLIAKGIHPKDESKKKSVGK